MVLLNMLMDSQCCIPQLAARPDFMHAAHHEIWKYCQSTSRVQAQVLENLRVRHRKATTRMLQFPTKAALGLCGGDGGKETGHQGEREVVNNL